MELCGLNALPPGWNALALCSHLKQNLLYAVLLLFTKQIVTRDNPIFEGELPLNGERFEALIPPVVLLASLYHPPQSIKGFYPGEYVSAGIMTEHQKEMIEGAVLNRQNILVVGGTGTGKTTLTNAIIDAIERLTPEHRLIIIEDTAEIQCAAKNANLLHATDTVDMLRLLKATMRLRPDRILVGEVRGPEALALLKAWNTGHPGGACNSSCERRKSRSDPP